MHMCQVNIYQAAFNIRQITEGKIRCYTCGQSFPATRTRLCNFDSPYDIVLENSATSFHLFLLIIFLVF